MSAELAPHKYLVSVGHIDPISPPHLDVPFVEMSNDASLPPNAPIINGPVTQPEINGEEDASPSSATTPASPKRSLEAVCDDLHRQVTAFLSRPPDSELVRKVQEQTRVSIGIIEKALNDYECVKPSPPLRAS